jgi:DNA polymerase-3 subunit alpha
MAFGQLEDISRSIELVVFPNTFQESEMILKSGAPLVVHGNLEREGDAQKIIVEKMERASDLLKKAKTLTIRLRDEREEKLALLKEILKKFPGNTRVELELALSESRQKVWLQVKEPSGVMTSPELLENLYAIFGGSDMLALNEVSH